MKSVISDRPFLQIVAFIGAFLACPYNLTAQEASSASLLEAQIPEAAGRILKNADKANCKPRECGIIVTDFSFSSGLSSQLGMQLADQFSKELASQQKEIQVIDRSTLRAYLEQERIPGALLNNEKATRWLGKQLGGTAVLTGTIENSVSPLRVKLHLLSCDKEKATFEEEVIITSSDLADVLRPVEGFPQKADAIKSADSPIFRAGANGVTQPACVYCPDPDYANAAREAKFNGTVLMEAVLSAEGHVTQVRIVRGAPYGLNQKAMNALQSWKLKPSTLDGKPVTVTIMIEIGFRLN